MEKGSAFLPLGFYCFQLELPQLPKSLCSVPQPTGDKANTVPSSPNGSSHHLCHRVLGCAGTELAPLGTLTPHRKDPLSEVKAAINTEGFPCAFPPRAGLGIDHSIRGDGSIHALLLQGGFRVARSPSGSRELHGAGLGGGHEVRGAALRGHLRVRHDK